jgi:hypothetical protein
VFAVGDEWVKKIEEMDVEACHVIEGVTRTYSSSLSALSLFLLPFQYHLIYLYQVSLVQDGHRRPLNSILSGNSETLLLLSSLTLRLLRLHSRNQKVCALQEESELHNMP